MNYIEIIGPQGAGKTTLLKKLMQLRGEDDDWCTVDEAIIEIAGKVRWKDLNKGWQRTLWFMRKADFFNTKINGLSNALVKKLRGKEDLTAKKKYEYLIMAQIKAIAELEMDISPLNLFSLMVMNYSALDRLLLLEEFNFSRTVVMDEGPFKTHYGLKYINTENIDKETLPSAVVFVTIDPEINVERIMKRYDETGSLSRIHSSINRDSIPEVTPKLHTILEENLKTMYKLKIPVIELDLGEELNPKTVDDVGEFITLYS